MSFIRVTALFGSVVMVAGYSDTLSIVADWRKITSLNDPIIDLGHVASAAQKQQYQEYLSTHANI